MSVKKTRPQFPLPENWKPSERELLFARTTRKDLNIAEEVELFRDYHLAEGSLKADWSAAWRYWIRNTRTKGGFTNGKTKPTPDWIKDYEK